MTYDFLKLTTLPQLKGNKYTICDISRNSSKHVTKKLSRVTNIISRNRPTSGSINRPAFTVPEVQRHTRQAIVVT